MTLADESVLIVESDEAVAAELACGVRRAGASSVGSAPTADLALRYLEEATVSSAIVNGNLRNGDAFLIAACLRERDIPFFVRTGHLGLGPDGLAGPIVVEPATSDVIVAALGKIVAQKPRRRDQTPPRSTAGHVLVIEDEPSTAIILEAHLRGLGYTSFDHIDCEMGALWAVRRRRPDLVVADIKLAQGSGLAAAAVIGIAFNVPRIIVTGYPKAAVGIDEALVVSKPFTMASLEKAIAFALARHVTA